ncbi:hypothetical protein F4604DRAFT_1934813 [Suillus subluteus]|nr:hypothetical protein F4604DRAFT_1934813 [Suillus subluteus]
MARTGHSTQSTSGQHRGRQPQLQKLTENEILQLKNYLPEWTAAKRSQKRAVFTAIARAARLFAPKVDQRQWKKRKQVMHPRCVEKLDLTPYSSINLQMYKTWLFNNKKKKERKATIKYGRKWTPRMVVYQQKREEVLKRIEEESGAKPGDPGMFKHYQAAAKETAEEWSNNCPPPEIQAQVACKKGPAYMEHFSNKMWRQCGMRVFVMSAWKNEKGEVLHDDNEALGDGDSFMKTKDWEDIEPVWQEYAQEQFGECWGTGMEDDSSREVAKESENQLSNSKRTGRNQEKVPAFRFKAWKNQDGDMVPSIVSGRSPSPQTHKARKQQRVTLRRPRDSSTESGSDAKNDTHHMEDDADEDLDDGRSPQKTPRKTAGPAPKVPDVPHAIQKPRGAMSVRTTGALLTSQMGDRLAGLTDEATSEVNEDVEMEKRNMSPASKRRRGKKAVVEPSARTTRSKSQMPVENTLGATRARGRR